MATTEADEPKTRRKLVGDGELVALGKITEAMNGLDEPTRARVMVYLNDRYGKASDAA